MDEFSEFKEIKPEVLDIMEPVKGDPLFLQQSYFNENDDEFSVEVKTEQPKDSDDEDYIPTPKKKKTPKKAPAVRKSKRTPKAAQKAVQSNENGQSNNSKLPEMDSDMHFLLSLVPFLNKAPTNTRLTLRFGIEKIIQDGIDS